jgi:hypothetical protein
MEDSIQKFSRLSHIANDFQLAAKTYAQIIGWCTPPTNWPSGVWSGHA